MSSTPLEIKNVTKSYGKQNVLKDVSFALSPGEIFGLIGLNGVGKTTLIKTILSLADLDSGSISIFGESSLESDSHRHLSYLPEKFQPSRYLKGKEYLSLSLAYYRKSYDDARARDMVKALDLDPEAIDRKVLEYSKGMGQKLGLAGAFLIDAPLLILDEPMSGLDPRARIHLKRMLLEQKKAGKTIFFSSHILSDIDEICDRIGIIHDNRIIFCGTPAEFKSKQKQASLEVAFLDAIEGKAA